MQSKTYKFELRIKGCERVFDARLAPGVIYSQESTFSPKGYAEERFYENLPYAIFDMEKKILEDVIEVIVTEVKDEADAEG